MNELITIIVPIYKVEKYIKRCVDSILSQTYSNLEIILVDDGSPDSCGLICDEYAKTDRRITVIHKKNGGLSDARNAGLERMHGKYVAFVDSDDFLSDQYIEKLYSLIVSYGANIAVCDENRFIEQDGEIVWQGSPYKAIKTDIELSPEEALGTYMKQVLYDASACMKLYQSTLFEGIRYPVGRNYEDVGTTYKVYCKANNTAFTPERLYFYFQRNGSILHATDSVKLISNIKDGIAMSEAQKDYVINIYPQLKDAAESRCFSMYCRAIGLLKDENEIDLCNNCWKKIKNTRHRFIFGSMYRKKVRMAALLSYFGRKLFCKVYRLFN